MPTTWETMVNSGKYGPVTTNPTPVVTPTTPKPVVPTAPVITPANLTPTQPITPIIPPPQTVTTPAFDLTAQETGAEQNVRDTSSTIQSLLGDLAGENTYTAEQQKAQDLIGKQGAITSYQNQMKSLQSQAAGTQLQLQQTLQQQQESARGQGITAGGLAPHQRAAQTTANQALLTNAIQQYSVGAQLSAAQGDYATALQYVDQAVNLKYQGKKDQLAAAQANLDLLLKSPDLTSAQEKRALARQQIAKQEERQIAKDEANEKEVYNIGITALKYGADAQTVSRIQSAKTPQEALAIGSKFLVDPKAKYEVEEMRLDNLIKQANLDKIRRETDQIGQPTQAELKQAQKDKEAEKALTSQAKAQIPVVERKIGEIDDLMKNLSSNVGPNKLSRTDFSDKIGFTADKEKFSGKMHQLVSSLSLDSLISAKERGATFGALSEGELRILSQSATAISDWEIWRDKDGNIVPTGTEGATATGEWNVTEETMKEELRKIKEFAELDLTKRRGQVFTPSENEVLDELFLDTSTSTPTNFDPSNYF